VWGDYSAMPGHAFTGSTQASAANRTALTGKPMAVQSNDLRARPLPQLVALAIPA